MPGWQNPKANQDRSLFCRVEDGGGPWQRDFACRHQRRVNGVVEGLEVAIKKLRPTSSWPRRRRRLIGAGNEPDCAAPWQIPSCSRHTWSWKDAGTALSGCLRLWSDGELTVDEIELALSKLAQPARGSVPLR